MNQSSLSAEVVLGPNQGKEQAMNNTSRRGFASMDPDKQRTIASKGGQAAHQKGTAHEFTSEEAREAGRKGGLRAHRNGESRVAPAPPEPAPAAAQTTPPPPAPVIPQAEMPQGMEHEMET